jgi:nucleoid-associated protein YejK
MQVAWKPHDDVCKSLAAEQAAHQQTRDELAAEKEAHRGTREELESWKRRHDAALNASDIATEREVKLEDELAKAREALEQIEKYADADVELSCIDDNAATLLSRLDWIARRASAALKDLPDA